MRFSSSKYTEMRLRPGALPRTPSLGSLFVVRPMGPLRGRGDEERRKGDRREGIKREREGEGEGIVTPFFYLVIIKPLARPI